MAETAWKRLNPVAMKAILIAERIEMRNRCSNSTRVPVYPYKRVIRIEAPHYAQIVEAGALLTFLCENKEYILDVEVSAVCTLEL